MKAVNGPDKVLCENCGHPYVPVNSNQRYCKITCRDDHRRVRHLYRPCRKCGEPLGQPRIQLHPVCRKNGGWARTRNKWRAALAKEDNK